MLRNLKMNQQLNFFKKSLSYLVAVAFLVIAYPMDAVTISQVDGTFSNAQGGPGSVPALFNLNFVDNVPVAFGNGQEDQIRWGLSLVEQSGLGFTGSAPPAFTVNVDEEFELGRLRHFNTPILLTSGPLSVDLAVTLDFSDPVGVSQTFETTIGIVENPNSLPPQDAFDVISLGTGFANDVFDIGGVFHTLEVLGFKNQNGDLVNELITDENTTNEAVLFARITQAQPNPIPEPSTLSLVALGLGGLVLGHRRKSKIK